MIITFKTKSRKVFIEIFIISVAIIITTFFPLSYIVSNSLSSNFTTSTILIPVCSTLFISSILLERILIVVGYYKNDKTKIITIDTNKKIFELKENGQIKIIPTSDIYYIYKYQGFIGSPQYYYKLIYKDPLTFGRENFFISYLTAPHLETYLRDTDFKRKFCINLFIPKKKNNA